MADLNFGDEAQGMRAQAFLAFLIISCVTRGQVTERGGSQGHAGFKNRGPQSPGPRLGPPGPVPGYLWGQSARSRQARGRAEAAAQGPARLRRAGGRPGAPFLWKSTPHPGAPARPRSQRERSPGHHCYPIIIPRTVATMSAPGSPRARVSRP